MKSHSVLFVCVHNAGRSQMAEALLNALAQERGVPISANSAGTVGGKHLNPVAVEVMNELGISMTGQEPKLLTADMVEASDRIISMGCGVDADQCPVRFLVAEDWELEDPAGRPIEEVRLIRDEIRARCVQLIEEFSEL